MEIEIFRTHVTAESPSAEIGPKSSDSFSKPSRMHSKFKHFTVFDRELCFSKFEFVRMVP